MKILQSKLMRAMMVTFVAFLFVAVSPLVVSAAPAFTGLSMDRTTIQQGQTITFSVSTTAQTNFVFAMVDGIRTQGTRIAGNDWSIVVSPARNTTVTIFANSTNTESGAVSLNIPVTVGAVATPTLPTVTIPTPPANLGPIAIASVTETPAIQANHVQLTVVTGREANEVWVNFNRVGGVRATGNFARATMLSQDANSRTWVLNFPLERWVSQTVEVGSNRTYNWPGADTQLHMLTLTQPFVPPVEPRITHVTVVPRSIALGSSSTLTITTNNDAERVWVRDVDGRETEATRLTRTATQTTWTVQVSPTRTGIVTVFANTTRTEIGAATRAENITVGLAGGTIIGTPTAFWIGNNETVINVTTNYRVETVWATMPGTGVRVPLNRTNPGAAATANRTWQITAWDSITTGNITIGVSSQFGNANHLTAEDSRTITRGGVATGHHIHSVAHWTTGNQEARHNSTTSFRIRTATNIDALTVSGAHGVVVRVDRMDIIGNEREWHVEVHILPTAPLNQNVSFTVHAYIGSSRVDSRILPDTRIVP